VPVPQRLVRTPRASGHVAASPIYYRTTVCTLTLFPTHFDTDPPRLACVAWVDEGVTEVRMRVQYANLFPTPLGTGPPRRAHMYCVNEGVTEGRTRSKAGQYVQRGALSDPSRRSTPHERSFNPWRQLACTRGAHNKRACLKFLDEGGSRGGGEGHSIALPRPTSPYGLRVAAVQDWLLPGSTTEDVARREEAIWIEWEICPILYTFPGPPNG